MEIIPINWLVIMTGSAVGVLLFAARCRRKRDPPESQIGWAILGALGAGAVIKSAYPLYRIARFSSIENVEDLWLYVYVGSFATFAAGLISVYKAWKAN